MPNFEINVTYRCNAACHWCNRLVGKLDWTGYDVTLEQVDRFCREIERRNIRMDKLKLAGGEPLVHSDLPAIIERLTPLADKRIRIVWVLTNSIAPQFKLPRGFKWRRSGVDDKTHHEPPLVSPLDLGLRGVWTRPLCGIARACGLCFESKGWTFCGLSGTIGRILGIDVHHEDPCFEVDRRICDHCIWSIGEPVRDGIHWLIYDGLLPHPTKTYAEKLGIRPQIVHKTELWPRHHKWLLRRLMRRSDTFDV